MGSNAKALTRAVTTSFHSWQDKQRCTKPVRCEKCRMLLELYERTPKSDRDYWMMTELFVMLHGGDVCRESDV